MITVSVLGAAAIGVVGLVAMAKSWSHGPSGPYGVMVKDLGGPSRVQADAGSGYVRLPRRLVK